MAFSVKEGVPVPPSLQNIFQEIHTDIGCEIPTNGFLESWAQQGVLLLNSILTVRAGSPGSHAGRGWENTTDQIMVKLQELNPDVIYLLWGNFARMKRPLITQAGGIFEAAHPSPLSAHKGFFGCRHFSKTNTQLEALGRKPIEWGRAIGGEIKSAQLAA